MRAFHGFLFTFLIGGVAWAIGAYVWIGLSIVFAIPAGLFGFVFGFFWTEIRLLLHMLGGFLT